MAELSELIEDLVYALEKRETVEPDVAAWEAEAEIRTLERRILGEFRPGLLVESRSPARRLSSSSR